MSYNKMDTNRLLVRLVLMPTLLALSACGTIKQWFPDKEKDYQHTTEIPDLVLPPDLSNPRALTLKPIAPTGPEAVAEVAPDAVESYSQAAGTTVAKQNEIAPDAPAGPVGLEPSGLLPAAEETSSPVDDGGGPAIGRTAPYQVEKINADGEGLRIHVLFSDAWRVVDKALGRKSIEVTDKNEQEQQFAVRYDPDEHDIQDGSFWDEVGFFLYGTKRKEKAYFITLHDDGQWTGLRVLDEEKKPAKDAGAAELLQLLEETIRSDLAR